MSTKDALRTTKETETLHKDEILANDEVVDIILLIV